jgi:hypothetical protein
MKRLCEIFLLIAGSICLMSISYAVLHLTDVAETEIKGIHQDAISQFQTTREAVLTRLGDVTDLVDRRTNQMIVLSNGRLEDVIASAHLDLFATAWDKHLGEAASGIADLPGSVKPALDGLTAVLQTTDAIETKLGPELFDTLGGTRIAAEATATTMRDIQHSVPGIVSTVQLIGANSVKLTDASTQAAAYTAQTMHNMAIETKPIPFLRYLVPLSEVGAATVGAAAAAGAFAH